jgi:hypothetical protein
MMAPLSPRLRRFGRPCVSRVATKMYRHLLGLDFHQLRELTFARRTVCELSVHIAAPFTIALTRPLSQCHAAILALDDIFCGRQHSPCR